ncbi:Crp/Fnr family transcriptional regulator [Flavitalea flava]
MNEQILYDSIKHVIELSGEDIALLMSCSVHRNLKKGDTLLKDGDICRSFYLVDDGYLRTYYNMDDSVINMNFTFEGEFASNLKSLRNRIPSELTIEAGEDASVWIFNLDMMVTRFSGNPQLMRFVHQLAISMLLASEKHSDLFKIYTPTERYRYIEKNNPRLIQRIPLSQMASYLGVARETLSRIRGKVQ